MKTKLIPALVLLTGVLAPSFARADFLFWLDSPSRSNSFDPKGPRFKAAPIPTPAPTATPTQTPNIPATQTALASLPPATQTAIAAQATQTMVAQLTQGVATQTAQALDAQKTAGANLMATVVAAVNSASFLPQSAKDALVAQVTQTGVAVMTQVAHIQETQTQIVSSIQQTMTFSVPHATQTSLANQVSETGQALGTLLADLVATQTMLAVAAAQTAEAGVMQTVAVLIPMATMTAVALLPGQITDALATQVATLTPGLNEPWPIVTAAVIQATQTGVAVQTLAAEIQATVTQVAFEAALTAQQQFLETVTPSIPEATMSAITTQTVIPMQTQLAQLAASQTALANPILDAVLTAGPGFEVIGGILLAWTATITPTPSPTP